MPVYHFNVDLVPVEVRVKWIDMRCPREAENAHDAHGISWEATRTDTGEQFATGYIDEPDYNSLEQAIPEIKEMCELDLDMRTWENEREESLDIELDLLIDAGREDPESLAALGWAVVLAGKRAGLKSVRQIIDYIEQQKPPRMPADWAPNEG